MHASCVVGAISLGDFLVIIFKLDWTIRYRGQFEMVHKVLRVCVCICACCSICPTSLRTARSRRQLLGTAALCCSTPKDKSYSWVPTYIHVHVHVQYMTTYIHVHVQYTHWRVQIPPKAAQIASLKITVLGVCISSLLYHLCTFVCLTLLASFFLPSHLSLKHVQYVSSYMYVSTLGKFYDNAGIQEPAVIQFPGNEKVVDVQTGSGYILAVTESGSVYTWGKNSTTSYEVNNWRPALMLSGLF